MSHERDVSQVGNPRRCPRELLSDVQLEFSRILAKSLANRWGQLNQKLGPPIHDGGRRTGRKGD